jgi:SpoVK/Ycf46/Vps4 family AAA+-type ATPase
LQGRETGVNLLLYGAPGTGKTQFACQLIERVGAHGFSVVDVDADGDPANRADRLSSLMLTQVFAPGGQSVVVLDEAEDVFQGEYNDPVARMFGKREEGKSWMNNLLEGNANPVIWISNRIDNMDPAYVRRFTYCLEFPRTPRGVRKAIAHAHLDPVGCSLKLVETEGSDASVSPAMLASAARFSRLAKLSGPAVDEGVKLMLGDMVNAMGMKLRSSVPERSTRFDLRYLNVRGPISAQAVMGGLVRIGRGRMLLSGPPGTGKTQLAAEIAQRLGRELVYKTASDINSMWFGQSERNVARMFGECDPKGEVLFLDEADTLLGSREAAANRPELAVTAEFLRQVEAFQGVFVCATNFGAGLDTALLRRFEYRLELQPLASAQRLDLFCEAALGWDGVTAGRPTVNAQVAARLGKLDWLTPGDYANVVRRVAALQLQLDAAGWVDELQAEHDAKPGARRAVVGFM